MFSDQILSRRLLACCFLVMHERGLKVRALSDRYDVNSSTIYNWRNGISVPPIEVSLHLMESLLKDFPLGPGSPGAETSGASAPGEGPDQSGSAARS